ncbi:MAG: amidase [Burkholderiaceae bacterium]|nr:amidase [Burkholderiaceae bacterium]MCD8517276.1 amidase [Burkholderiaceae bacterium]MCD8537810.1 amidase [Burkholderiaceae bacterium]
MTRQDAFMTMTEIADALAHGQFTSVEITRLYLDRIAKANGKLHAYVSVDEDLAISMARAADERRAKGVSLSQLDGVPFAAKDLCELKGTVTTAGSQAWIDRRSELDCTALMKCLQAGMVMLGKTHMVEFAFGGWGTNPIMGTPWNPWDLQTHRVPGGSSSGSGVAVAAGLAPAAIGSDTGGSVRIPSGLNGLTGLKTTRGLISLHGAASLSFTLDTIGPMVHSAEDAALWTAIMAGPDPLDKSSLNHPPFVWDITSTLPAKPLLGVKLGVLPPEQYPMGVDPDELAAFEAVCATLKTLGAVIEPLRLPFDFHDLMVRNGQIIAAEAYALHQAYIEDENLPLGQYVRQRILGGKSITAAQYIEAIKHQRASGAQYVHLMQGFAALITPTFPFPAIPLTEVDEAQTPMAAFCRAGNYLATCGLVLPAGLSKNGLPLSVQLMGKPFDEVNILKLGVAVQAVTDWHRQRPDLDTLGI